MNKAAIEGDNGRANRGQYFAMFIALAFLGAGTWLVSTGHDFAGGTIATAAVIGLVSAFLTGARVRRDERIEKAKLMTEEQSRHNSQQSPDDQNPSLPGMQ